MTVRYFNPKDVVVKFGDIELEGCMSADYFEIKSPWRCGLLFRPGSCWIGVHWSRYNRRFCINVVPFVTFWVTLPGGITP